MNKYNIIQHYPGSEQSCHCVLSFDSKKKAKDWIKHNGVKIYRYTIQKVKLCKSNLITVPYWLDFQPVRTRYINAVKEYRKLCGW